MGNIICKFICCICDSADIQCEKCNSSYTENYNNPVLKIHHTGRFNNMVICIDCLKKMG